MKSTPFNRTASSSHVDGKKINNPIINQFSDELWNTVSDTPEEIMHFASILSISN